MRTYYSTSLEWQVNNWIRYAICCNVQDLNLSLTGGWKSYVRIVLDELLFINSNFTHLKLSCRFVNPTGAFSWKNLKSLSLLNAELNEDLIQRNYLELHAPGILSLKIYGDTLLDIQLENVSSLVEASVYTDEWGYENIKEQFLKRLKELAQVKELKLGMRGLE
ncbi:hypothetical protein Tco_1396203, partial [Tanacetum coccineum]